MADSSDVEKKSAAVDDTLADDRSAAEGQVYQSEGAHADLNSERRYGEYECIALEYEEISSQLCLHSDAVRKLDLWLLPFLSMMYFFNSIDRVCHIPTQAQQLLQIH